ncbi:MAG: hypothetical protein NUV74_18365 [Candidatus Brocadiaceae bacterium]|nr:hypothetical protein [Candidatus Brocadiaceae bacterium]
MSVILKFQTTSALVNLYPEVMERWCIMAEIELVFKRTCNYWIDAGIVGFYDILNKPLPNSEIGDWSKTTL